VQVPAVAVAQEKEAATVQLLEAVLLHAQEANMAAKAETDSLLILPVNGSGMPVAAVAVLVVLLLQAKHQILAKVVGAAAATAVLVIIKDKIPSQTQVVAAVAQAASAEQVTADRA